MSRYESTSHRLSRILTNLHKWEKHRDRPATASASSPFHHLCVPGLHATLGRAFATHRAARRLRRSCRTRLYPAFFSITFGSRTMTACAECGKQISGGSKLDCSECGQSFCREHYHGHDCTPVEESNSDNKNQTESNSAGGSQIAPFGYVLSVLIGVAGFLYLLSDIGVILSGGDGGQALQAITSMIIAGSFFSCATFLMVSSYIVSQSSK